MCRYENETFCRFNHHWACRTRRGSIRQYDDASARQQLRKRQSCHPAAFPLSILFLMLVYQWIRMFNDLKMPFSWLSLVILALAGYILAGYAYQLHRLEIYREILAEAFQLRWGQTDWDQIESITSGGLLSIHMNNQFFNWNTYFMMIAFSLLLCFLYKLIQHIMNRRQGTSAKN